MTVHDDSTIELRSPDGAQARITPNGAHATSWIPAGSLDDRLFVSARTAFGAGASIRGGVPVIFPQFGMEGPLPKHGFARNVRWTLLGADIVDQCARARLLLIDDATTRAIWPHAFEAEVVVLVGGAMLDITLSVENTGAEPFTFTAALHPYFRVADAHRAVVTGLAGTRYRNALKGRLEVDETEPSVVIREEIDRVYYNVIGPLEIREPHRTLRLEQRGFRDAVVWNPGVTALRGKADFVDGEEREMLCVEAATVQHPVVLAPGERWSGAQVATAAH